MIWLCEGILKPSQAREIEGLVVEMLPLPPLPPLPQAPGALPGAKPKKRKLCKRPSSATSVGDREDMVANDENTVDGEEQCVEGEAVQEEGDAGKEPEEEDKDDEDAPVVMKRPAAKRKGAT